MGAFWNVFNVRLWERYGSLWTWRGFWHSSWKNTITHIFSRKAISRALFCYFLVNTALQMTLIKHLLPETTSSINEKVSEETTDQNFSNVKFLTSDAAHTHMVPPFIIIVWGVLRHFSTYLMTSSKGIKSNDLKPTRIGNVHPSVTLVKIWGQLHVKCSLRLRLYLWGDKNSFVGNWVEVAILAKIA